MVPVLSIVFMFISLVMSFAVPVSLLIIFKKRGASVLPFFTGCAVMLLFAFVLESLVHAVVLSRTGIASSVLLYALYGGFAAALFEEGGRYLAFRTVLKKRIDNDQNALMYGAGHGGFEAAAVLGTVMAFNLFISLAVNSGKADILLSSLPAELSAQLGASIPGLVGSPSYIFILGLAERLSAMALQISFSVMVWFCVKNRKKGLFFLAFFCHAAVDALTVILTSAGVNAVLLEVLVLLMAVLVVSFARREWVYNREKVSE